ncbi:GNAT family N-acetyltransferase [Globicatella sanguinis]|uniref:GNAT family N-acetyltransferase n=1 Tax=Globicatella sanguinis TaxID=13076 RepID=UPI0008268E7B|nr:GNAT family N-acetyltransferase [Globicatella sanguinis]MDK7630938.1 GNAT family N-acetyltransferase [Globicatella sanguinis]WIK65604.1 GNAT family N-acetyltransferase [Globicatella sanguinis]WKT55009.1 GNAT family N-acetyltransferase [Globicatella sanguinis]
MSIVVLNHLSSELRDNIHQLEQLVHQVDHTYRWLFLSNQYNFNQTMPFLVLYYHQGHLVGVGTIYAEDTALAEVASIVHPQYRKLPIKDVIVAKIKQICRDYRIRTIGYKIERKFYQQYPAIFNRYRLNPDAIPELILQFGNDQKEFFGAETQTITSVEDQKNKLCDRQHYEKESNVIQVRRALPEHLHSIAHILAECFDDSYYEERLFVERVAADSSMVLYQFSIQNQIIGTCSIEVHPKVIYLFAVAIKKKQQNKGFGTKAIAQLTIYLTQKYRRPLQIQADKNNKKAIKLYQKLGFKTVSEWIELIEK